MIPRDAGRPDGRVVLVTGVAAHITGVCLPVDGGLSCRGA